MYDQEKDLKELGYKIIWKQTLSYAFVEGQIQVIGAVHPPTGVTKRWMAIIKFSGQGGHPGSGSGGGFLYTADYDSREEASIMLMTAYQSVSINPSLYTVKL